MRSSLKKPTGPLECVSSSLAPAQVAYAVGEIHSRTHGKSCQSQDRRLKTPFVVWLLDRMCYVKSVDALLCNAAVLTH